MRPAVALFLGVFLCGALAGGAGDAGKKAGKEDHKRLLGEWEYVEQIIDGKKVDQKGTWTFTGNQILYGPDAKVHAVFKLDATKKPKTIDSTPDGPPEKAKPILGIYEFDGETLKICNSRPGKDRPTDFEAKEGSEHTCIVWQREKK